MEDDSDLIDVNGSDDKEENTVASNAESGYNMNVSDSNSDSNPGAVQVVATPITQPGPSQLRAIRRNYLWQATNRQPTTTSFCDFLML